TKNCGWPSMPTGASFVSLKAITSRMPICTEMAGGLTFRLLPRLCQPHSIALFLNRRSAIRWAARGRCSRFTLLETSHVRSRHAFVRHGNAHEAFQVFKG